MVFVCAGLYMGVFARLRRRFMAVKRGELGVEGFGLGEPDLWLALLMVVAAVAYTLRYPEAVNPTQGLTLVGAGMIGQGAAFCQKLKSEALKAEGEGERGLGTVEFALIVLLAGAALLAGGNGPCVSIPGTGAVDRAMG